MARMRLYATTGDSVARLDEADGSWSVELSLEGSPALCLAVDPADADTVYVGLGTTACGGRTTAAGPGSSPASPGEQVFSIAVSAADGAVYAGTEPSALYRSDDRGQTWRELAGLARAPVAANLELSAAAVDVACPLDRSEPARGRARPRRHRARRADALDRRRRDLARPPAGRAARRPLARLASASRPDRRTRPAAAELRGATTPATPGTRPTRAATATTRGRSPSIPTTRSSGTCRRARGRSRRTVAAATRRRGSSGGAATGGTRSTAASRSRCLRCRTRSSRSRRAALRGPLERRALGERRSRRHVESPRAREPLPGMLALARA